MGKLVVASLLALWTSAAAAPPSAYQCYPGRSKVGEGCACPTGYAAGRDAENTAVCKPVPRPAITAPARLPALELVSRSWQPRALPTTAVAVAPLPRAPISVDASPVKPPNPGPTDREVEALRIQLSSARGPSRLPILHRLVDALTARAYRDPRSDGLRAAAFAASKELIEADGFASYGRADVALFNHGELLFAAAKVDEARAVFQRLVTSYPNSVHVVDVQLWMGERAFEAGDMEVARKAYEPIAKSTSPKSSYARYKLGWVHLNLQKYLDAMRAFEDVAKADPRLRRMALRDLVTPYLQVGLPDKAFDYFERLDAATALERTREVANGYADLGQGVKARTVYRDLVMREKDPAQICAASMGALQGSIQIRKRDDIILDADAFAQVASSVGPDCKAMGDKLFAEVAFEWHRELAKTKGDARDTIEMWRRALSITVVPERRDVILHNLAIALWDHAAALRGARPVDWIAAGEALQASSSKEDQDAAIDAYDNAIRAARATSQTLHPMIAAKLRGGLSKIPGERAKKLLAELR